MKKPFMAVLIAFVVTACVGASIIAIGGAAMVNKNGAQVSNSPDQASGVLAATTSQQSDQVNQLQSLVSQYQDREQQYRIACTAGRQPAVPSNHTGGTLAGPRR